MIFDFPQWSVPVAQQLGLLRVAIVLAVAAALTAVFAPLTTRLYRRG